MVFSIPTSRFCKFSRKAGAHRVTRPYFGIMLVALSTAAANQLVWAQCFVQVPGQDACWTNGNNPCTYNTCRLVDNTCDNGSPVWTYVNMLTKPPNWPRCTYRLSSSPTVCSEDLVSCGTTQNYLDNNCSMPCNLDNPGGWTGCGALLPGSDSCF
jgi:hypothetical protein